MTGIININKPSGWTSQDVVSKLRGILKEKRVGHGGTLDPLATGVLPVFVGRATRAVQFFESADKEYLAGLRLGIKTDTQDITGIVLSECPVDISHDALEAVLTHFRGVLMQIPPMYSAVKVGGKKLYEIARRGGEVERSPRQVNIFAAEIINGGGADFTLRFEVSKGTYIRTLCADIGDALGCGGAMCSLVRTRAGTFTLDNSHTLETVEKAAKCGDLGSVILPVDSVFNAYETVTATPEQVSDILNGRTVYFDVPREKRYRVYTADGSFIALAEASKSGIKILKSFFEVRP